MKKRVLNIITIVCILLLIIFAFSVTVYADGEGSVGSLIDKMNPSSTSPLKKSDTEITKGSGLLYLLSNVFTLLQFVGTGISLIAVIRLGIGYMLASVEEKADIKKRAWPIVFGSVFIVATVNVMKIISNLVLDAFGNNTPGAP